MVSEPLVSVVIPVYNAGEYLETCLCSVAEQTYKNLEILLVDDGSTDDSPRFCDAFAKRDVRFRVIRQENQGAASARKQGVLRARGDYLCFADADDRMDAGMIAFLADRIGTCDLITSGCYSEDRPGEYTVRTDSLPEGIYDTKEAMRYFIDNMIAYENRFEDGVLPFLWNKMYRTDWMKAVIADGCSSITYAEDRELLFRYILKCDSIRVAYQSFYYYRYKPDSIMRTARKNFMRDLNELYLSLEKVFEKHPQKVSLMRQLELFLISRIDLIPAYMWFSPDVQGGGYVFPFPDLKAGSRIVLYGAGRVGVCYYRQIFRQGRLQMVLWADKNWEKRREDSMPVSAPACVAACEYDYIVVAVKEKSTAEEIRRELVETGIPEKTILWRMPAIR
ncbi:MAG: glycosyltransferase family 2 protein [Lachnospiraceae bacterium]|nr:glycosyltransferase family 2 protein [Lachnospiraceae bacterium]